MNEHEKINYVEFPAKNLQATKDFFAQVFGWSFEDYGLEYTAFLIKALMVVSLSLSWSRPPAMVQHS